MERQHTRTYSCTPGCMVWLLAMIFVSAALFALVFNAVTEAIS